jgi:SAM-dependent methyltransferase
VYEDWYEEAFGDYYEVIYAHRTIQAAEPEAAFAASHLHLTDRDAALDLCCGTGRHLYHLAKRTAHAFGLDYSPVLLAHAARSIGAPARLVRADMRHVPFTNAFDVVTSFFTSFGYFLDDHENERVIVEICRILRRGGRFFLDHVNATHLRQALEASTVRMQDPYEIHETRWIDEKRKRINKSTRVFRDGVSLHKNEESVRLYSQEELTILLQHAGLSVDAVYGNFDGADAGLSQPRMLFVGHKD